VKIQAGSLVPFAFVAVAAAWAIAKAEGGTGAISQPASTPSAVVPAAATGAAESPTILLPTQPATSSQPTPGATPSPPSQEAEAPPASVTATAYPAVPVAPSAADEIAATDSLHRLGKTYLQALIDDDPAPIAAMLASRCAGSDPSAILARRRAEVTAEAGVPIETLVAIAPVVAHLDVPGAEAHTVIQFDAGGERHTLATADGWVLEGGAWRNAEC